VSRVALILGCMELSRPPLVVAFELSEKRKAIVGDALAGASAVVYLTELDEAARAEALRNTGALLTFNTSKELRSGEAELLGRARLIQFIIAGVDFIPLGELPEGVPVATNGGGYAESMGALADVAGWIKPPDRGNEVDLGAPGQDLAAANHDGFSRRTRRTRKAARRAIALLSLWGPRIARM
jgi:hypothetical protein